MSLASSIHTLQKHSSWPVLKGSFCKRIRGLGLLQTWPWRYCNLKTLNAAVIQLMKLRQDHSSRCARFQTHKSHRIHLNDQQKHPKIDICMRLFDVCFNQSWTRPFRVFHRMMSFCHLGQYKLAPQRWAIASLLCRRRLPTEAQLEVFWWPRLHLSDEDLKSRMRGARGKTGGLLLCPFYLNCCSPLYRA